MNDIKVSVVTASYNMCEHLGKAVYSVLNQSYDNIEIIVIDDGSTDGTPELMRGFAKNEKVKYIRFEHNKGQTSAKNRGLQEATGNYIGFCDADNMWMPNKLEIQVPILENNPNVGVVYSDMVLIDNDDNPIPTIEREYYEGKITGQLLAHNFVNFNSALVRKESIEQVNGFDENLTMGIDWDLWLRISVNWEFKFLKQPTYYYRIWANQMSHKKQKRLNNAKKILDKFRSENGSAVSAKELNNAYAQLYFDYARVYKKDRQWFLALQLVFKALILSGFSGNNIKKCASILLRDR